MYSSKYSVCTYKSITHNYITTQKKRKKKNNNNNINTSREKNFIPFPPSLTFFLWKYGVKRPAWEGGRMEYVFYVHTYNIV